MRCDPISITILAGEDKNITNQRRTGNVSVRGALGIRLDQVLGGRPQADILIEKAIIQGHYAYTLNTASARLKPPPHVPPVTMLDPSLLDLFDRAFCTPQRPTATEWRSSLDKAMTQLVRCKNDPRHSYLPAAAGCPWCGMIATARLMFFLPKPGTTTNFRPENLQDLLNKLVRLQMVFDAYTRPKSSIP